MFVPTMTAGEPVDSSAGPSGNDLGTLVPLFTVGWTWAAEADLAAAGPPPVWMSKAPDDGLGHPTDPTVGPTSSYPPWTSDADPNAPCNPKPPVITGVSPSSGPAGTTVTITGNNFGGSQGTSTALFGGAAAGVSNWSANGNSISAVVPSLVAGPASVVVRVGSATSAPFPFAVTQ
jgi:hypothetical protein